MSKVKLTKEEKLEEHEIIRSVISFADWQDIYRATMKQAKNGNIKATQLLLDRFFGKITEKVDHTTNGQSINTTVIFKDGDNS